MPHYQRTNIPGASILQAACALLERRQRWAGMRTRLLSHLPNEQLMLGTLPAGAVTD